MNLSSFFQRQKLKIGDEELTPELAARWLIMSAYLYYHRDSPVLPDGDYDEVSKYVADNLDELSPQMQWQLESPEAIRATGQGIKITPMGESASIAWYKTNTGFDPVGSDLHPKDWRKSDKHNCLYITIG